VYLTGASGRLSERGAHVTRVRYMNGFAGGVGRSCRVTSIARDEFDVVLFTTAIQVNTYFKCG